MSAYTFVGLVDCSRMRAYSSRVTPRGVTAPPGHLVWRVPLLRAGRGGGLPAPLLAHRPSQRRQIAPAEEVRPVPPHAIARDAGLPGQIHEGVARDAEQLGRRRGVDVVDFAHLS